MTSLRGATISVPDILVFKTACFGRYTTFKYPRVIQKLKQAVNVVDGKMYAT